MPAEKSGPTIFFLARHEPRKGLSVLLKAAAHLPSDVSIWIGGHGPETERLKAEHAHDDRLVWLGSISDADKASRLRAADVFCVPSLGGESFGAVLLEGMAAETPVVASDLEAYRVTSGDGADARLSPTGDARALAAALTEALEHGSVVERRVSAGLERAEALSMDALADAYLARYERVIG